MPLYTPFLKESVDTVGQGYGQNLVGNLMQKAYLGDDNALGELARYSPQAVQQIQQQRMQQQQAQIAMQAKQAETKKATQEWAMQNKQFIDGVMKVAAQFPDFESAQQYINTELNNYKQMGVQIPDQFSAQTFTPQAFDQIKKIYPAPTEKLGKGDRLLEKGTNRVLVDAAPDDGSSPFLSEINKQQQLVNKIHGLPEGDPSLPGLKQQLKDITDHIATLANPSGADKAGSTLGKAAEDLKKGIITQDEYNALRDKETGIAGGKMGSRAKVFLNRTLISANEAAKDLENVVNLPAAASTGLFGGRKQGAGLFDATKEVLANKMTGQDAQSYNVMATGFQRSLAGLESAGLAPSGSLTHQMDSVLFKEGDTNLTKLQKLAQTRQIVEAALESTISDPDVPKEQKSHAEEVIAAIKKSVPFTQKELIGLQIAQEKNPNLTLKDMMARSSQSAPQAAVDHLKAHPELKEQFKAKYGYLPEGM